ncbi:MAG: ASKHA domain-containing protein [Verrucomicrobia bacterium]|nr:ASKHA domain-containing protein [Verrucomicrobiota bacterium]
MNHAEMIVQEGGRDGHCHRLQIPAAMAGRTLTDLLALHDFPLNARCGQRGWCRGCMVELRAGELLDRAGERIPVGGMVRSCQMRLPEGGSVVLAIPERAQIGVAPQVGETFMIDVPYDLAPLFPVVAGRDTAFAVDIGTTTVVVLVVDLTTGEVLARAGGFNAQIRFGDNVLTRIGAGSSPAVRQAMRRALVEETLAPLLQQACARAGREPCRLAGGTVAGNTTMLHILADEDPTSLGIAPFTARFLAARMLDAGAIGLAGSGFDPALPLQLLPGLAAYVGADITAGVHATGMTYDRSPSLLVDMGTNGEVVLGVEGRLLACATAAGPAFEGAGLSSGTRAQAGAIETIRLAWQPFAAEIEAIGGQPAAAEAGICGSAYVDFLATARTCGLLQANGRFDRERWLEVPPQHRIEDSAGLAFRLAGGNGGAGPRISEIDIAHLLQAKAAIGAGIATLLDVTGIAAPELGRVYLAGGFGMHIEVAHAIGIGLLPGFAVEQVRVVGNTALAGALLAVLDRGVLAHMESLRSRIEVIELNLQECFEDRYIDHLSLPGST